MESSSSGWIVSTSEGKLSRGSGVAGLADGLHCSMGSRPSGASFGATLTVRRSMIADLEVAVDASELVVELGNSELEVSSLGSS